MVGPERLLPDRQGALVERFGLSVAALGLGQEGQVIEGVSRRVRRCRTGLCLRATDPVGDGVIHGLAWKLRALGYSGVARVRGLGGCVDLGQVASPSEQLHLPSLEVIQSAVPQA